MAPRNDPTEPRAELAPGPELAIVAPTFNERDNVEVLYERICDALAGISWELVFVDDDSPDGTSAVVQVLARSDRRVRGIRRVGRRGLASACIEGILATSAPYVVVMDADLQHDETLVPTMLAAARDGAEVVIASRYAEGGSFGAFGAKRRRLSELATRLAHIVLRQPISDPMSGFFLLRRDAFDEVVDRLTGSGFKILLDILASTRRPLKLVELPLTFGIRVHGESKLDALVGLEYLELLLDKAFGGIVPVKFLLFAAVGGLGLVLHLSVLWCGLNLAGLGFAQAQTVGTVVAMTSNFFLNNLLTYRASRLAGWRLLTGLLSFYAICAVGAVANVGVGSLIYAEEPLWWLAGTAGAVVGAVWNFAVTSIYTWRRR